LRWRLFRAQSEYCFCNRERAAVPTSDIIAIDILLEPDATMLAHAQASNTRLRAAFPQGFALDAQHSPHITLLQCFVAARDVGALCDAVGVAADNAHATGMELRAVRHGYTPGPGMGVAGIWMAVTPELLRLQADVIAAAAPFMETTAGIDAFTAGHDNPAFDTALIDYVSGFVEHGAGTKFDPHVSTGVAPTAYLDTMVAEPFAAFDFTATGAAVYQLGPFGTAARLLQRLGTTR
jgi:hypothetical protein